MVSSETPSEPLIVLHCSPSSDPYAALYLNQKFSVENWLCVLSIDPAYLVVLCEEELVVIDLVTKEAGWDKALHVIKYLNTIFIDIKKNLLCMSLVKSFV